jgi:hypothetical protein
MMGERVSPEAAIPLVETFWDLPDGALFRLRDGYYEPGLGEELADVLSSIEVDEATQLPRRFVSLTWMIPSFMEWQVERVEERGGDVAALRREITVVRNALDRLLGTP